MQKHIPSLLSFCLLLTLMVGLLSSKMISVSSQPNIGLDGVRDAGYTRLAQDPSSDLAKSSGPGDWAGTVWTDLTALYTADDGANLWVYVDLPAYARSVSSGEILLALDTTGDIPTSGGASDPWGNAISFAYTEIFHNVGTTPQATVNIIRPDFVVRGNIPGIANNPPDDNNGWTEFRSWNGSSWAGGNVNWGGITPGGQVGARIAYADNQGVEISIPWASLGVASGSTVHLQFLATQKGATKGAYDTLSADDQATGWDDATTQTHLATIGSGVSPTSTSTSTPTGTITPPPTATTTPTPTATQEGGPCAGAAQGDNALATSQVYHDSLQLTYRSPQGSIPANGSARLRLRVCQNDAQSVEMWVWKTGDPLATPSNKYTATVAYSDSAYDYWEYNVPGPGMLTDQWYQFKVVDGGKIGYYHVLAGSGNSGPGAWSDSLLDQSWRLGTAVSDYTVPAWMQDAVIYQVFPDRFRNGNPANDPVDGGTVYGANTCSSGPCVIDMHSSWNDLPNTPSFGVDFFGGDLQGVIDKLDYLQDLGVNVIYFNPIFAASSNHGYDTNDYYAIRNYFGDNALFDTLVAQANAHGMRVILDGVYNHVGSDSKYMDGYGLNRWSETGACESTASPYRSWFKSGGSGSGCDGDWKWSGWYGFETIPELLEIDAVKAFFYRGGSAQSPGGVSVTQYWLDKGVAGWRFDVAQDISLNWWSDMRPYVKTTYGSQDALMLGEVTGGCDWGLYRSYLTENGLDSVMNYCFRDWVKSFAEGGNPSSFDNSFNSFRGQIPASPWYALMNLISSHDSPRMLNLLSGDKTRLKLAVLLQMTLPGAPSVYYGDEVALAGGGDPDNRRTYPWADKGGSPDLDMYNHFRKLIGIRNAHSALRGGGISTLLVSDAQKLYSFVRWNTSETLVVVLNNGDSAQSAIVPVGSYLPTGAVLTDLLNGGTYTVTGGNLTLNVPARWGAILHIASAPPPVVKVYMPLMRR